MAKVFGLTGGIAAGKSTVSKCLAEEGVTIVDADLLSREVVLPGTAGLEQVISAFGEDFRLPDGTLNRPKLGAVIFSDKARRAELEAIVLPLIRDRASAMILDATTELVCYDAPTLIETGQYKWFHPLVVVITDPEMQVRRVMRRNNLSREEAQARVDAQVTNEVRRELADLVIDTSGPIEGLRGHVLGVLQAIRHGG